MKRLQEAIMDADKSVYGWQTKLAKELGVSRAAVSNANKKLGTKLEKEAALATLTIDDCGAQKRVSELREEFKTLVKSSPYSCVFIERACGFPQNRLTVAISKGSLGTYTVMKTLAFFGKKLAIVDLDEGEEK